MKKLSQTVFELQPEKIHVVLNREGKFHSILVYVREEDLMAVEKEISGILLRSELGVYFNTCPIVKIAVDK